MSERSALIAGGGIAGLATAIALSRAGFVCRVLERSPSFSEAGAGIQIGPNGTRVLRDLGVLDELAPEAGHPGRIVVRDGLSQAELSHLPLGAWIESRHGAPYWTAHRADLHGALARVAARTATISIEFGFDVSSATVDERSARIASADGRQFEADILVAADGHSSNIRRQLFGGFDLMPAGRSASRTVIAVRDGLASAYADHVGIWLAPQAHVVHYPVRSGQEIAVVVVTTDEDTPDGWGTETSRDVVLKCLAGLSPKLLELLGQGKDWRRWSLVATPPLDAWSKSRAVLVGDATGPIMPFLAQGAVMALEDSVTLAAALRSESGYAAAFARYEKQRRPRRQRVSEAAIRNGNIYHLSGPMARARNLVLKASPASMLMSRYDWLYGFRCAPEISPASPS